MKWTSGSAAAAGLFSLVQTLILAHLLTPADFGLMAAAMIVAGLAQPLWDLGLTNAVIVRPSVTREALSSVYWANVLAGLVLGGLVVASTPLVAAYFHTHGVARLMPWVALVFATTPIGSVYGALMQRELRFETLAKIESAGAAVGFVVAVTTAALGAGALAMVWGLLAASLTRAVLVRGVGRRSFRPLLRLRLGDLEGYLSFGAYQMGHSFLNYLFVNLDYLLIGRFLGAHALGSYSIAYQLVTRPQTQMNPILTRVATPVFAKRQSDDAALGRGYLEIVRLIAFVTMPLLVGLAVVAPAFVPAVFGPRWHDSILPLQLLAFVGILSALGNPLGSLTLAKNRPDIEFKLNLVMVPLTFVAILLAVHDGISSVAFALLCLNVASFPLLPVLLRWLIGLRPRAFFAGLAAPAGFTAAMALAAGGTYRLLTPLGSRSLTLAGAVLAGTIVYLSLLMWREGAYVRELWSLLRARRPPGSDPAVLAASR